MATEDERYRHSSQYRLWSFSPAGLQELRHKTNATAKQQIAARLRPPPPPPPPAAQSTSATADTTPPPPPPLDFLTPDEEVRLVRFFTIELMRAAQFCELPTEVRSTAAALLRRFYVTNSVMTYPPTELLKTSLFFGCKAEGLHIRLARLADKFPDTTAEQVLAGEFLLCQGVRFAFDVRHPFRALEGAVLRLRRVLTADADADASDSHDHETRIAAAHLRAREILKFSALVTDAYFHYAPSQIMMAALRMADPGLVDLLIPRPAEGPPADGEKDAAAKAAATAQAAQHTKILAAIEACQRMLEEEPPERMADYWGKPETVKSMKPLRKKLQKCRDPDRADLVAFQRARREQAFSKTKKPAATGDGGGGANADADARHSKRPKTKTTDDVFGPSLG